MKNTLMKFMSRLELLVMLTVIMMLCAYAPSAFASDFGLIKLSAPQVSAGIFTAMDGSGSAAGTTVAVVTHKAISSDNILASVIEGWVPLSAGGTTGAGLGGPSISLGSGVNMLPATRTTLLALANFIAPNSLDGIKSALTASSSESPITAFVGPNLNLVFTSLTKLHTKGTVFYGAKFAF